MATTFDGDVAIAGNLTCRGDKPVTARTYLAQENLVAHMIPITDLRIWDAFQTLLTTAANDDLGMTAGAFATGCPYVDGGDVKTLTTTRYARGLYQLPEHYVAGQTVKFRAAAGMLTTVAGTSCTLDFEAYLVNGDTLKSGSDLVTTAAQSINTLVFANYDFTVSAGSLVVGNWLDFRIAISSVDAATGTVVRPAIAKLEMLLDIKG